MKSRDWQSELEDRAEELAGRTPAPPPERPLYAAGKTTNPGETARLAYRDVPPAECTHPLAAQLGAVCRACGLERAP
jgi:hypothetical protein